MEYFEVFKNNMEKVYIAQWKKQVFKKCVFHF